MFTVTSCSALEKKLDVLIKYKLKEHNLVMALTWEGYEELQ